MRSSWPATSSTPRDAVQVKYEMVRTVRAGGAPVTEAAAAFGYSRPACYAAAAALESAGLEGLVPARPGPRGGHKLTEEVLAWAEGCSRPFMASVKVPVSVSVSGRE